MEAVNTAVTMLTGAVQSERSVSSVRCVAAWDMEKRTRLVLEMARNLNSWCQKLRPKFLLVAEQRESISGRLAQVDKASRTSVEGNVIRYEAVVLMSNVCTFFQI